MPAMPRMKSKATKIAYAILGVPQNIKSKRTKAQEKINRELIARETRLVR